jgi:hypothetical protein
VREELHLHVMPRLRDPTLVIALEGWNDAGEAASSAARYLAQAIQAVPLAELDPEEFFDFTVQRPEVRQPGGARTIEWPSTDFRFGSIDTQREIVIGVGPEPHLRWRRYTDLLAGLASDLGIRRVVLLGAYLADVVYSRPVQITGFASSPELLASAGVERSAYEGPTGMIGVLGERFIREGCEVLSLWAGLPHYVNVSPNPRGSYALLQMLGSSLSFKVDDGPLRTGAAAFEERVSAIVAGDPELSEYVRQLKRREFAQ